MNLPEDLEPKNLFRCFAALCAIPHGSGNTAAISDYCVRFARERGIACSQDDAGNVLMWQPASPGCEAAAPLILQAHLDMVCEKEPGCTKDMQREGLELCFDGHLLSAKGTSLGGDDGIGVAMILAALEEPGLEHPPLEAVLTVDEEVGMLGAAVLDASPLAGRRMLNLDSEEEGVLTAGCAGGCRVSCRIPAARADFTGGAVRVSVGGLTGGHSGSEIDKGRGNAVLLLGRVLRAVCAAAPARIVTLSGGFKDNAIPTAAEAVILAEDTAKAVAAAKAAGETLAREYRTADPGAAVTAELCKAPEQKPFDRDATDALLCFLLCCPNGVAEMSREIPGLVETSLNLGIFRTEAAAWTAAFCVRSGVASRKKWLVDRLTLLSRQLGGEISLSGDYPAWEYRADSPMRRLVAEAYREQSGREPAVVTVHGGLECGLLSAKLPGLDCVSVGPELHDIHTCRETLDTDSAARTFALMKTVITRCCRE